ncbi:uncharacterized protein LOC141505680 [Macrotis lagotis]|uniref:uncharacterized protein LOC141505680 n=1 Tax=Macrotis lagotis TaxID=92651 RepID=UPI003D68460A
MTPPLLRASGLPFQRSWSPGAGETRPRAASGRRRRRRGRAGAGGSSAGKRGQGTGPGETEETGAGEGRARKKPRPGPALSLARPQGLHATGRPEAGSEPGEAGGARTHRRWRGPRRGVRLPASSAHPGPPPPAGPDAAPAPRPQLRPHLRFRLRPGSGFLFRFGARGSGGVVAPGDGRLPAEPPPGRGGERPLPRAAQVRGLQKDGTIHSTTASYHHLTQWKFPLLRSGGTEGGSRAPRSLFMLRAVPTASRGGHSAPLPRPNPPSAGVAPWWGHECKARAGGDPALRDCAPSFGGKRTGDFSSCPSQVRPWVNRRLFSTDCAAAGEARRPPWLTGRGAEETRSEHGGGRLLSGSWGRRGPCGRPGV